MIREGGSPDPPSNFIPLLCGRPGGLSSFNISIYYTEKMEDVAFFIRKVYGVG